MSASPSQIDHEVLWQTTVNRIVFYSYPGCADVEAQLKILNSLNHMWISPLRVTNVPGSLIVGGFGDVQQAKVRSSIINIFGDTTMVAIKKLRPAGDRNQRIRVIAVSKT